MIMFHVNLEGRTQTSCQVTIPLTDFSDKWSPATGEQTTTCAQARECGDGCGGQRFFGGIFLRRDNLSIREFLKVTKILEIEFLHKSWTRKQKLWNPWKRRVMNNWFQVMNMELTMNNVGNKFLIRSLGVPVPWCQWWRGPSLLHQRIHD